ncbi:MAG: hypothetical protein JOZ60_13810 [Verrucomicrobia bacterium]|nr:hypothetical protein [Verrucomicrobiota bacterium]
MQKYQPITGTSLRGAQRTTFADAEREQFTVVGPLLDVVEDNNQQRERVLCDLEEKPTDLERFVYLIRLCDRNERLFYNVLMSDRIRFLVASDSRRKLLEIWLHLPPFARHAHLDPSQRTSRAVAA